MAKKLSQLDPHEVFMDSSNLPNFDVSQFEGRIETPISTRAFLFFSVFCLAVLLIMVTKVFSLQVLHGQEYRERSERNSLKNILLVAPRGIVYSRYGEPLAWNEIGPERSEFPRRIYTEKVGLSNLLGFVKYPAKDKAGFYYEEDFIPKDGVEKFLNEILLGKNGNRLIEVSVDGQVVSESATEPPVPGEDLTLSIDSRIQQELFKGIKELALSVGFHGGSAVIMDVHSGEILAMTTFPEYDSDVMTEGEDSELIAGYFQNQDNPFLDRAIDGLYTPGSIVKPFLAFGALEEGVISPEKEIVSTGRLVLPNPYNPDEPSIFRDWKAHGAVDMRRALAVSSDVYFYQIGGGFENQKGLGIERIEKYFRLFGFGEKTGITTDEEPKGLLPNPEWKEKTFDGEIWRIGDTYHTAIGQYGMQVTPLQVVRAVSAVANGGYLVTPSLIFTATSSPQTGKLIGGTKEHYDVVREGMRMSVTEGTALGLNTKAIQIAGKTGTAELGVRKQFVNSWSVGFFPYQQPRYAFAIVMERGPVTNLVGATSVMRRVIDWMAVNAPEYFKNE